MKQFRAYWQLTKPGVTAGNVLTVLAGYFLAAAGIVDWRVFVGVMIGMTLVIASACALNNYLDRDIDAKMARTKKRPSVTRQMPPSRMLLFAVVLLLLGMAVLIYETNYLVVTFAALGYVTYVWLYGAWTKRSSVHGTVVGSISGAFPIIAGYAAANPNIDYPMVIAFLILFLWQFPEFYSIAIYRRREYEAAGIPLVSIVYGVPKTVQLIAVYTALYVLATTSLTVAGATGVIYAAVMSLAGVWWLWIAVQGLRAKNVDAWARRMFRGSMYHILLVCVMLPLGPLLP